MASATTNESPAVPIVFIHGWKASVLVDKNTGAERFNYALPHLLGLGGPVLDLPMEWEEEDGSSATTGPGPGPGTRTRQAHDDMVPSHPTRDVSCLCGTVKLARLYGPLLDHLAKKRGRENVHCFSYDWRRELAETASKFESFLERVKSRYDGVAPQVVGHSMGCLVALNLLNRRPGLFHSVLFGAGAMAPNFSLLEDYSIVGRANTLVRNDEMFAPSQHLTNPGPAHMLMAYPGEREKFGKEHAKMLFDAAGDPVEFDLNRLETWREYRLGMYHPESGVKEVTAAKEAWLQSVLDRCLAFRRGLIPSGPPSAYPPVAVLHSDGLPTKFGFHLDADGHIDFDKVNMLPGDGRVVAEDSLPPEGIPVAKVITNKEEHTVVLNDLRSVDELLDCLVAEAASRKK